MSGELPHTGGSAGPTGLLFILVGGAATLASLAVVLFAKLKTRLVPGS